MMNVYDSIRSQSLMHSKKSSGRRKKRREKLSRLAKLWQHQKWTSMQPKLRLKSAQERPHLWRKLTPRMCPDDSARRSGYIGLERPVSIHFHVSV